MSVEHRAFHRVATICAGLALTAMPASAAVKMPLIFGNGMVLQREIAVPVWGWAAKGEKITVTFAGQTKEATADDAGNWTLKLDAMLANKTAQSFTVKGENTIAFKDVLVGDVWICSGQSNMEFGMGGSLNAPAEMEKADLPLIRHIKVQNRQDMAPQKDIGGGTWAVCTPKTVGGFTAVGFFFARELVRELDVPVGLIGSNWGGTRVEPWTPPEGFRAVPELKDISTLVDSWSPASEAGQKQALAYLATMKEWQTKAEQAVAAKAFPPALPTPPWPAADHQQPTKLYNAMISPVIPYGIRGAIWYQGESNGNEGVSYLHKLKALIGGWRQLWGQGEFPFYMVQLANFQKSDPNNAAGGDGWARLREAQFQAISAIPNCGTAVIIDVGEANDIHPRNKQDVGKRLALWALAKTYKKDVVYSGPLYKGLKLEGNKARISFDSVGGGLMVAAKKGLEPAKPVADGKLKWFAIAGEDKAWKLAEAVIEGNEVVVSSPDVAKPVAVRYAFAMNPDGCNLYNKEGLPASPFRTDSW